MERNLYDRSIDRCIHSTTLSHFKRWLDKRINESSASSILQAMHACRHPTLFKTLSACVSVQTVMKDRRTKDPTCLPPGISIGSTEKEERDGAERRKKQKRRRTRR
mmetsp:Transcript_33139/g.65800  ORF Transcript_33139/g.65800 Transcript_33139/m.65800 type:complete len:106 (-) Transcript_33139:1079-1396(-)